MEGSLLQAVTVPEAGTGLKLEGEALPRRSERSSGGGRARWDLLCELLRKSCPGVRGGFGEQDERLAGRDPPRCRPARSGGLQAGRSPPVSPLKPRPHVCVSQGLALCLAPEAMDPQVSTVKTEVTENTTHPLSNETAPSVSTER